jgi:hypothetical protein
MILLLDVSTRSVDYAWPCLCLAMPCLKHGMQGMQGMQGYAGGKAYDVFARVSGIHVGLPSDI